jgi:hypothetical protein
VDALRLVLFAVGYPVAIAVIVRLVPVFRERRTTWFLAEEAGTAAIVAGWAIAGRWPAVAINAAWGVGLAIAWFVTGRRRPR